MDTTINTIDSNDNEKLIRKKINGPPRHIDDEPPKEEDIKDGC